MIAASPHDSGNPGIATAGTAIGVSLAASVIAVVNATGLAHSVHSASSGAQIANAS
jgi:hypothetical protein